MTQEWGVVIGFAHRKVAPEIRYCTRSEVQATVAQQKDLAEATELQSDAASVDAVNAMKVTCISRMALNAKDDASENGHNDFATSYCRCGVLVESQVPGFASFIAPR